MGDAPTSFSVPSCEQLGASQIAIPPSKHPFKVPYGPHRQTQVKYRDPSPEATKGSASAYLTSVMMTHQ